MIKYYIVIISLLFLGCESEPPIAGDWTANSVCSGAGYLIRLKLGDKYKTNQMNCKVLNIGGNNVRINSGYVSPFGSTLRYTAEGAIIDDRLIIEKIMVHDIDKEYISFSEFSI